MSALARALITLWLDDRRRNVARVKFWFDKQNLLGERGQELNPHSKVHQKRRDGRFSKEQSRRGAASAREKFLWRLSAV